MAALGLDLTPKAFHTANPSSSSRPGLDRLDTSEILGYYSSTDTSRYPPFRPSADSPRSGGQDSPSRSTQRPFGGSSRSGPDSAEATPTTSTFQRDAANKLRGRRERSREDVRAASKSESGPSTISTTSPGASETRPLENLQQRRGADHKQLPSVTTSTASSQADTLALPLGSTDRTLRRRSRSYDYDSSPSRSPQTVEHLLARPKFTSSGTPNSDHRVSPTLPTPPLSATNTVAPTPAALPAVKPPPQPEVESTKPSTVKPPVAQAPPTPVEPPRSMNPSSDKIAGAPSATSSAVNFNGSFLFYDPVSHSGAGPPPPLNFSASTSPTSPPPRPPRRSPSVKAKKVDASPSIPPSSTLPVHLSAIPPSMSRNNSEYSIAAVSDNSKESDTELKGTTPLKDASNRPDRATTTEVTPRPNHTREGAFPPASVFVTHPPRVPESTPAADVKAQPEQTSHKPSNPTMDQLVAEVGEAISDIGLMDPGDAPPPNIIEPSKGELRSPRRGGFELHRDDHSDSSRAASVLSRSPERPAHPEPVSSASSTYSYSPHKRDAVLIPDDSSPVFQQRQLPIARSSSLHSLSRMTTVRQLNRSRSGTSSPSLPRLPASPKKKLPPGTAWPDAMWFQEVLNNRSTLERSMGYAKKINELASYESSLGEWTNSIKNRSREPTSPLTPATPSNFNRGFGQPRRTSRGSMTSDTTFPTRPDAWTATNLSARSNEDHTPGSPPPSMPYPTLAQGMGVRTSPSKMNFNGLGTSQMRGVGGGFFATIGTTIGRRGSTSTKSQRPALPQLTKNPTKKLMPLPPVESKPVEIKVVPTIIGGPRAAPSRPPTRLAKPQPSLPPVQTSLPLRPTGPKPSARPNSMTPPSSASRTMPPPLPPRSANGNGIGGPGVRSSWSPRNPTMPVATSTPGQGLGLGSSVGHGPRPSPKFTAELEKLSDVLPDVERSVLAAYLQKTGSHILAINAYIEDKRNGTISRI